MVQISFDSRNVQPSEGFDLIPPAWYSAQIIESEMKSTNSGNGSYLQLTIEITGPSHAGRKVWARLNLDNPNPKAVEIANRDLSAICHATGKLAINDSAELHGAPFMVKIATRRGTNGYEDQSEPKGYKPMDNAMPGTVSTQAAPVQAQAQAAPPAGNGAPWGQR